jgi:hypothetical protein
MMKQRWSNRDAPAGLLNISISDITYGLSDDVKRNILKACNECALSGHTNDREYASLLNAETGMPLDGCHLLEGTENEVDINIWAETLENANPLSFIILHNHTKETHFHTMI